MGARPAQVLPFLLDPTIHQFTHRMGTERIVPLCNPLPTAHVCSPLPDRNSLFSFPRPILAGATVSSNTVEFAFLFLDQIRPTPDPDCVAALRHIMCIAARPPCNETVQNLLPICSDSCMAYTRIFEEEACTPIIEYAQTLQATSGIQLLEFFVELFIQVDCANSSTYYFYEDIEPLLGSGSDGCTDLFSSEDKKRILSRPNQCMPTPSSSICDSTTISQYTHYIPLRSRNTTTHQQLLGDAVASGKFDKNCTDIILSLGCYITFPPCDPETGDALPLCLETCDVVNDLIQSCATMITLESVLATMISLLNCSDVNSYLPEFVHGNYDQCVNVTDMEVSLLTSAAVSVIAGATVGAALFLALIVGLFLPVLVFIYRKKSSESREMNIHGTVSFRKDGSRNHRLYSTEPNGSAEVQLKAISTGTVSIRLSDADRRSYEKVFSSILVPYAALTVGKEIGQGAFGKVLKGEIRRPRSANLKDIAIKTIKNLSSKDELESFFAESLLMKDFRHPNILLAGVCFDTPGGVPYIILPFMTNGCLKDFLKKRRTHLTNVDTLPEDLSGSILVHMCLDIAKGMEYLAEKKFVHRDLAARNCMVDTELVVKVGDFGLARDIYSSDYYRANQGAKIPVKWMAPETLHDAISNEKTDVWSFGVTCWEVFSLGRGPYPGIQNQDILKHISMDNKRLERPSLCPKMLFDLLMTRCWRLLPEERPPFSQLVQQLQEYWEDEHTYVVENIDDNN